MCRSAYCDCRYYRDYCRDCRDYCRGCRYYSDYRDCRCYRYYAPIMPICFVFFGASSFFHSSVHGHLRTRMVMPEIQVE